MYRECCPECGHLLSNSRNACPFCNWDESSDQYSNSFKIESDLSYNYNYANELGYDHLSEL